MREYGTPEAPLRDIFARLGNLPTRAWIGAITMSRERRPSRRAQSLHVEGLEDRQLMAAALVPMDGQYGYIQEAPAAYGVSMVKSDVSYTRNGSQLDAYRPTGAPPPPGGFPAIIALPGGGWRSIDRRNYGASVVAAFVPYGYVVVPTDYLYASPGGANSWPGAVKDVRAAVRWVRSHADSLGVNPNKIVVSGESAGAHLATLAGVLPERGFDPGTGKLVDGNAVSGKPNAVVDFYGPTDLANQWRVRPAARPYLSTFLGGSLDKVPERFAASSPITHVSADDPPTYIIQGDADKIIPVADTVAFDAALKAVGVPEQLTIVKGIPHGFRFHISEINLAASVRSFLSEHLTGGSTADPADATDRPPITHPRLSLRQKRRSR